MATLENGFVKIYRQMTRWEWYQDANACRIFLHLLITVNYEDNKWQGITIPRGSRITSYEILGKELKLTVQQVRTAINKLKSTGEITSKSTNKYTLLSVVKYNDFQALDIQEQQTNQQATQQMNNNQITNKQQTNNNKERNIKKYNKEKKDKEVKNIYGEFQNVKLTASELEKLKETFGTTKTDKAITFLDEYIAEKNYKSASHYLAIRRWVINAVDTKETKQGYKKDKGLDYLKELYQEEVSKNDTRKEEFDLW